MKEILEENLTADHLQLLNKTKKPAPFGLRVLRTDCVWATSRQDHPRLCTDDARYCNESVWSPDAQSATCVLHGYQAP